MIGRNASSRGVDLERRPSEARSGRCVRMMVATLCSRAQCGNYATYHGNCETHRYKLPSSTQRGYDYEWQQLRKTILIAHPVCQFELCTERSAEVDHVIPLSLGGQRLDRANLQALCRHHNRVKGGKGG